MATHRIALLGGIYNNYLALEAALLDIRRRDLDEVYCLGDLGAFGPYPDRVFPLLDEHGVQCVQGNYDDSIGNSLDDCQCGYTDPRDNHFAQISYDYTLANTSADNRAYLRSLPTEIRLERQGFQVLLCHGSPRKTNEFLWESTTSTHFLDYLAEQHSADIMIGTHTGLKWIRPLSASASTGGDRWFCNCGVLGRPENDGTTNVWFTVLSLTPCANGRPRVEWEFVPVHYDHHRLAKEMEFEGIPQEFVDTIRTGWWTTCLEILPGKERACGEF